MWINCFAIVWEGFNFKCFPYDRRSGALCAHLYFIYLHRRGNDTLSQMHTHIHAHAHTFMHRKRESGREREWVVEFSEENIIIAVTTTTATTIDGLLMVKANEKAASKKEKQGMKFYWWAWCSQPAYTFWFESNHLKKHTTWHNQFKILHSLRTMCVFVVFFIFGAGLPALAKRLSKLKNLTHIKHNWQSLFKDHNNLYVYAFLYRRA